jgi:hypothetical protein
VHSTDECAFDLPFVKSPRVRESVLRASTLHVTCDEPGACVAGPADRQRPCTSGGRRSRAAEASGCEAEDVPHPSIGGDETPTTGDTERTGARDGVLVRSVRPSLEVVRRPVRRRGDAAQGRERVGSIERIEIAGDRGASASRYVLSNADEALAHRRPPWRRWVIAPTASMSVVKVSPGCR